MDLKNLSAQFPALQQQMSGKPLVYLDSAATTQKPVSVVAAIDSYYQTSNANVHRSAYQLAAKAN